MENNTISTKPFFYNEAIHDDLLKFFRNFGLEDYITDDSKITFFCDYLKATIDSNYNTSYVFWDDADQKNYQNIKINNIDTWCVYNNITREQYLDLALCLLFKKHNPNFEKEILDKMIQNKNSIYTRFPIFNEFPISQFPIFDEPYYKIIELALEFNNPDRQPIKPNETTKLKTNLISDPEFQQGMQSFFEMFGWNKGETNKTITGELDYDCDEFTLRLKDNFNTSVCYQNLFDHRYPNRKVKYSDITAISDALDINVNQFMAFAFACKADEIHPGYLEKFKRHLYNGELSVFWPKDKPAKENFSAENGFPFEKQIEKEAKCYHNSKHDFLVKNLYPDEESSESKSEKLK